MAQAGLNRLRTAQDASPSAQAAQDERKAADQANRHAKFDAESSEAAAILSKTGTYFAQTFCARPIPGLPGRFLLIRIIED
jgi:hypothetical protein